MQRRTRTIAEGRRRSTRSNFALHPERFGFELVSLPIHTYTQDALSEEIEKGEREMAEISADISQLSMTHQASAFLAQRPPLTSTCTRSKLGTHNHDHASRVPESHALAAIESRTHESCQIERTRSLRRRRSTRVRKAGNI